VTNTRIRIPRYSPLHDVSALLWNEFDEDNLGYEDQDADLGTDFEDDDLSDVDGYTTSAPASIRPVVSALQQRPQSPTRKPSTPGKSIVPQCSAPSPVHPTVSATDPIRPVTSQRKSSPPALYHLQAPSKDDNRVSRPRPTAMEQLK